MKNGFLKVGIPVLCAVPVAAGFATMGYSAATALTGNFRVECDFCSFDSDDVFQSTNFYIDVEKGWTLSWRTHPSQFVSAFCWSQNNWLHDSVDNVNITPSQVTEDRVWLKVSFQTSVMDYSQAIDGDYIGINVILTLENTLEKGQTKSYPASFTFVHKYGL